ncbi:uncharacterized protein LOC143353590 [Halictus rubicundus]|uniref:uncharacterized protein LOC143353590 n=1 Tax=Halictus rubicundus TaxID=77578 RepID=UPI00403664F5
MKRTRRIFLMFLGLSILAIAFVSLRLVTPTILRSKYQLYSLRFFGFFYTEQSRQADWACVHLSLTTAIGLLTIACTEGSLAVFALYLCGLFEIVSYRIRKTVDNAAQLMTSNQIDIGPAIVMHQRAFKLSQSVGDSLLISYLLAIVVVIVSFAVNLYRASLLLLENTQLEETLMAIVVVVTHIVIMFLNNYSGQQLCNTCNYVYDETYNSMWYAIPPKSQKLLLLVLMRSANEVQLTLAGLFVPCYQGFTMMMSSSFSYFTVLYSV